LGQFLDYLPGNFTTTNWGGNVSFFYDNGSIFASARNSSFSLDYNGSLTGNPGGVRILDNNTSLELTVSFGAYVSASFKGISVLSIIGESSNSSVITYFHNFPFNVSTNKRAFEFNATLPLGTHYLGFRIGFYGFTGTVYLPYVNFTIYSLATPYPASPFGDSAYLRNNKLSLPAGFGSGYIIYSSQYGRSPTVTLLDKVHNSTIITGNILGVVLIKSGLIGNYSGKYAVINEPISRADLIINNGEILHKYFIGEDGSYIFPINGSNNVSIVFKVSFEYEIVLIYALLITISFSFILQAFFSENVLERLDKIVRKRIKPEKHFPRRKI
jgi:hypothetical protein